MERAGNIAGWIIARWSCESCRFYRRMTLLMAVLLAASFLMLGP